MRPKDAAAAGGVFRPDVYRSALTGTGDVLPGANSKVEGSLGRLTAVTAQQGVHDLGENSFFDGGVFDPDDIPGYLARLRMNRQFMLRCKKRFTRCGRIGY